MKMTARLLVVSILVVLSFGLLWAQTVQGTTVQGQNQALTNAGDRQIDLATATHFIANLKNGVVFNLNTNARVKNKSADGGFVARTSIEKILAQPGAVAVRYYFAQTDAGQPSLIIVGVDTTGKNMTTGVIMMTEPEWPCPPYCPSPIDK